MSEIVKFKINGKEVEGKKGEYVLSVARRYGFDIPTLCHNDEVEPQGNCRTCMVEVFDGRKKRMVTACLYPVKEGIEVYTDNENVRDVRKVVFQLLMARAPKSEVIRDMAKRYAGVESTPYQIYNPNELCILCGLCVRVCDNVVGVSAIGMSERGIYKKVGTPFDEPSDVCIGCGACAYVCPTNAIPIEDKDGYRIIWNKKFKMKKCVVCGKYFMPEEQADYYVKKYGVDPKIFDKCPSCR